MSNLKPGTSWQAGVRSKSRRGRNPTIDAGKIENAVREIGAGRADLSMKEVADHLGVNVTTLYRHVGGIDGLRRIRAALSHGDLDPLPTPEGRTWKSWMRVLSDYYRRALILFPTVPETRQPAGAPAHAQQRQPEPAGSRS